MDIKTAIELVKKSHPYATKYKGVKEDEALQILIDVATQVVEAKEPKLKDVPERPNGHLLSCSCIACHYISVMERDNKAIHDFRLWQVKCLGEVKDAIYPFIENYHSHIGFSKDCQRCQETTDEIIQAIHNLFNKEV